MNADDRPISIGTSNNVFLLVLLYRRLTGKSPGTYVADLSAISKQTKTKIEPTQPPKRSRMGNGMNQRQRVRRSHNTEQKDRCGDRRLVWWEGIGAAKGAPLSERWDTQVCWGRDEVTTHLTPGICSHFLRELLLMPTPNK
jgi:hypothetical protein